MNTVFLLLSSIITKIDSEIKIINSIFNFNIKEKKMIMKVHSFKEFKKEILLKIKKTGFSTSKSIVYNRKQIEYDNKSKNNLITKEKDYMSSLNISENKRRNESQNCIIKINKDKNEVSFENYKIETKRENIEAKKQEINIRINKDIIDRNEIFDIGNKNRKNIKDFNEHIN